MAAVFLLTSLQKYAQLISANSQEHAGTESPENPRTECLEPSLIAALNHPRAYLSEDAAVGEKMQLRAGPRTKTDL